MGVPVLERSNKSYEDSNVIADTARDMLCAVAGDRYWNDTRESWLARAARRLGWPFGRTRAVFYRQARVITAAEWIALNNEIAALRESATRRRKELNNVALGMAGPAVSSAGAGPRPLVVGADDAGEAGPRLRRAPGQ